MSDALLGFALLPFASFLVGSIPFGLAVARMRGVDIRKVGSGNIGATNVMRSQGKALGALVLLLDLVKGLAPALVALRLFGPWAGALAGLMAMMGHCYSIFLKGKGGKGVATGLGVFLALSPKAALAAAALFLLLLGWKRYVSLGSMIAALSLPILVLALRYPYPVAAAAFVSGALIVGRHRENIARLIKGREPKLGARPALATPPNASKEITQT